MNRKVEEKFEKTGNVKSNDKYKNYILRGERNAKYIDRMLSKLKEKQQELL